MKRTAVNLAIDSLLLVGFLLLTSTGLVMRYVLPPGSGQHTLLWGSGRHDWGSIHFWIAVAMAAAALVHLLLHWKWIVATVGGVRTPHRGLRLSLAAGTLLLVVAVLAWPLVSPKAVVVDRGDSRSLTGEHRHVTSSATSEVPIHAPALHEDFGIRGSMSIAEAAQELGLAPEALRARLQLPPTVDVKERLGPLRRAYGFDMQQVRDAAN